MQRFMVSVDGFVTRRRALVVAVWAALLIAAVPFAMRQSDHLTGGGFSSPGSQSDRVVAALEHAFPHGVRSSLGVVLTPERSGPQAAAALSAALARAEAITERTAHVSASPGASAAAREAARAGGTVVLPISLPMPADRSIDVAISLRRALGVGGPAQAGVSTHLVGQGALWAGLQDLSKKDLKTAETTGFPIVLLILLAVFGSLAAATLPLLLGVTSVVITGALIYWLSLTMQMSVFVTNMASMVGIGVAVDYSLFVLARYREEIAAGRSIAEARRTALATSGVAVIFSGATVVVALAGLWMVDNAAIRSMALGAMLVVSVSVLGAATLLPALISFAGVRAARGRGPLLRLRRRGPAQAARTAPSGGFWMRWTQVVTRRPLLTALATAALLLTIAVPALSLRMGSGALEQFPPGNETRTGFEAAARVIGPGASSPIDVLVRFDRATPPAERVAALRAVERRVAGDPAVARIGLARFAPDGVQAAFRALPRSDGESAATKALIVRLRATAASGVGSVSTVLIGGSSAATVDFNDLVSGSMWKIALFVLALSYVILLALLRSVLLPLKAVVMNLLSVGAAYGVLVAVFQWGWGDALLGVHAPGHLDTLTPALVLAVVFGLSMDYEVFLLTRIRERWQATGDSRLAVAEGLASSARTITSAALIMVSVFAVFVGTSVPSVQELGLGNAVAVLLDATLVRLVLVPATMELLGDWNWWLPRPLRRILPRRSLEAAPA